MQGYWSEFCVVDEDERALGGNLRHGDTLSTTPTLWRFLVDRFAPRSVLDVGAGEGHALSFFHRMGLVAHGFDGLESNVKRSLYPIALHDLRDGPYRYPCDLVYCVEVVEHIEPEHVDSLLATLTNAPIIAMTFAVPGQPGHHHVNTQPEEYWVEKLAPFGYRVSIDNEIFRKIAAAESTQSYFSKTGLVMLRSLVEG